MNKIPNNVKRFLSVCATFVDDEEQSHFKKETIKLLLNKKNSPESPIEQFLLISLNLLAYLSYERYFIESGGAIPIEEGDVRITPQKKIGRYRVDFLLHSIFLQENLMTVVECDGHHFHERSEKERRAEKKRDRFLQRMGYKSLHFTGSEIVQNPYKVACEVLAIATKSRPNAFISCLTDKLSGAQLEGLQSIVEIIPLQNFEKNL